MIITDAHGCTFHLAFDIDEPTPLFAEIINFTDVSCDGGSDGTATVNATGGVHLILISGILMPMINQLQPQPIYLQVLTA